MSMFEPRFNGRRAPRPVRSARSDDSFGLPKGVGSGFARHFGLIALNGVLFILALVVTVLVVIQNIGPEWLWVWALLALVMVALFVNFAVTARNMMKGF